LIQAYRSTIAGRAGGVVVQNPCLVRLAFRCRALLRPRKFELPVRWTQLMTQLTEGER
jgi:hypothetical protein